ncbi:MAG: hypothetical protein DMF85_01405 [Acidobacteria bacterium]|nr:MAG: hypothetical protein DMF85_01405 [Acidobacteriota bacterium]PYR75429.1 MAG: hypothetical protein DMF86_15220 [Acidobacteriota bacterium]
MRTFCAAMLAIALAATSPAAAGKRVLVLMDERPQMEALASYLRNKGGVEATIVDQKSAPADWSGFDAVVAYIHGALQEPTELAIIKYTKDGGRYVCLHHSISSGKAANRYYFDFLGVRLDGIDKAREPSQPGDHYAWRHDIDLTVVNLNPGHYITTNGVTWPEKTAYRSGTGPERERPAFTLKDAEVYMNVPFTDGHEKTVLLGFKYLDDRNGALYMQDSEGWVKRAGKGWIVYLQMGHTTHEFEHPAVAQMVLNAIAWTPEGTR